MSKEKQLLYSEIVNCIFKSKEEDDTIEHIDMSYSVFLHKIRCLADYYEDENE